MLDCEMLYRKLFETSPLRTLYIEGHIYLKSARCFVYMPCDKCKHIYVNELIRGMVVCLKNKKPHRVECKDFSV
jgi:hypothetical protein